jgi:hypothetical protein
VCVCFVCFVVDLSHNRSGVSLILGDFTCLEKPAKPVAAAAAAAAGDEM